VGAVWANEIQHWDHLHRLKYTVAVGTEAERLSALKAQADIYIINRENVQWLIEKSGIPFDFDMVVVDELSSFKNYQSKRFKALMKARPKVKRMVGLTGTPSSKRPNGFICRVQAAGYGEAAWQIHRAVPQHLLYPGQAERAGCFQLQAAAGS
jgi:SNF2 family DNA or RNA helicase